MIKDILVKAVIFDMDGVITNTMPDHFRSWQTVLKEVGIHLDRTDVYRREGQKGALSIREILTEHDVIYNERLGQQLLRQKEELFKKIVRQRFILGARQFINNRSRQGFRLALVTGTSRHELERILPARIKDKFEVVITANDVHHGKPHPEPFLAALKNLRLAAGDAVVLENAPFGIDSAKRAGLKCFALATSLPACYLKSADRVFSSYQDLNAHCQFILKS